MSEYIVRAEDISKRFLIFKKQFTVLRALRALLERESLKREFWALRDVSFQVRRGEKIALIGKNGSGKTTLLRVLTGIYGKDSGTLSVETEPIAIFRLLMGLSALLPVVENIYLLGAFHKIPRKLLKEKEEEILALAELSDLRYSLLKKLSTGQQQRLALSVFFQATGGFFIFDESTAFIDASFALKCEEHFRKIFSRDTTVIMTSHNSFLLRRYCSKALWLDEGRLRAFGGLEEVLCEYEKVSSK